MRATTRTALTVVVTTRALCLVAVSMLPATAVATSQRLFPDPVETVVGLPRRPTPTPSAVPRWQG